MRKIIFYVYIAFVCSSCLQKAIIPSEEKPSMSAEEIASIFEKGSSEEKWAFLQEFFIAPGARISDERPLPNVLSEKEILLKAAEYAIATLEDGYKIDTPILVSNAYYNGEPNEYYIVVVDSNGNRQGGVNVSSNDDSIPGVPTFGGVIFLLGHIGYISSKQEAANFIQSYFPGAKASEPMMVNSILLDTSYSSSYISGWYFTIENEQSVEEYIIPRLLPDDPFSINMTGFLVLNGEYIARLDKPLHLFERREAMKEAGGSSFYGTALPSVNFKPIPNQRIPFTIPFSVLTPREQ